jgi:hypothetical protein
VSGTVEADLVVRGDAEGCWTSRRSPIVVERARCIELAQPRQGSIERFLNGPPGELVAIEGVEEALQLSGALDVESYRQPAERLCARGRRQRAR